MASYLRPRRGKKSVAIAQGIILRRGEIFFEAPTTGVGTGLGKIKMGDGSTTYSSLPYFTNTEDDTVAFTNVTATTASTNNTTYLSDISPNNNLKILFNRIKQLLFNLDSQVNNMNTKLTDFQIGVSTIVGAINAKAGSNHAATAAPSTIAATVSNLNLGITPSGTLEKNANGTYDCTNYAAFKVNVPASAVTSGTASITSNGTHNVTTYASANVQVPASAVTSGTKSITVNGNNQDVTSYKYVNVAVPQYYNTVQLKVDAYVETQSNPDGHGWSDWGNALSGSSTPTVTLSSTANGATIITVYSDQTQTNEGGLVRNWRSKCIVTLNSKS